MSLFLIQGSIASGACHHQPVGIPHKVGLQPQVADLGRSKLKLELRTLPVRAAFCVAAPAWWG